MAEVSGSAQGDVEMKEQIDSSGKGKQQEEGEYVLENNLIFAQADSLRIFTHVGAPGKE